MKQNYRQDVISLIMNTGAAKSFTYLIPHTLVTFNMIMADEFT